MTAIKIRTKRYNTATGSARMQASVRISGRTKTHSIPYPYEMNTDERHKAAAVALVKDLDWSGSFDSDGYEPGMHVFYRR